MAHVVQLFPFAAQLSDGSRDLFAATAALARIEPGAPIARPGEECQRIALVTDGEVRVHKTSPGGRDLTLYYIFPGQTCVLTAFCLLAGQAFPAHADAVIGTTALIVPRRAFQRLFDTEPAWRDFVFSAMSERIADLLALIDGVLFTDLPTRLADALLTQQEGGIVRLTHEQLAGEIGSSREVVSRVLKSWERQGIVSLARGRVAIVSRPGLLRLLDH